MNATKLQLLKNEVGDVVVKHINGWEMFLVVSGAMFWLLVLFAVVRWAVLRSEWLTEQPTETSYHSVGGGYDIPEWVICTCPPMGFGLPNQAPNPKCPLHGMNANKNHSNHVGVLSISDFKRVDGDAS